MKTKIPPPAYMLIFAALMWLLDRYLPLAQLISAPWHRVGLIPIVIGFCIDLYSMSSFLRARTSPNPFKPENASTLVIGGLYRFTRNPMYLGMVILLFGWALYLCSLSPFFLLPLLMLVLTEMQIKPEEQALTAKFGQSYVDFQQQVRRWL